MKTKVIIRCEVSIDMGSSGGYHANDDVKQIREAMAPKAFALLNEALSTSKIDNAKLSIGKPKFTIILTDD